MAAIEQAFIEVFADTDNFDKQLRRSTSKALRRVADQALEAFKDTERYGANAAIDIGNNFRAMAARIGTSKRPLQELSDSFLFAKRRAEQAAVAGKKMPREITAALNRSEQAVRDFSNLLVEGPEAALRELRGDFNRFSQHVRASFGRAAVAGPEKLEASFRDLRSTGMREIELLEHNVQESFNAMRLEGVEGLERLDGKFKEISQSLRTRFKASAESAENNLRQMFHRGELSADEFRAAIAQVAVTLDRQLEQAVEDVNRDLRLLAGHEKTFRRIAGGAEQAARSIDEVEDQTRQTARQMDRVEDETRGATAAMRLFGRTARTQAGYAHSSFGKVVARMNRLRFLFLNTRFIIAGIGAFAAARFARFGIEAASSIEQARLSFQTLARSIEGDVGDAFGDFREQANTSLESVIEFARETPFSLEQVADGVRKISAFLPSLKIASEDALSTMEGRTRVATGLFEDMGAALAILGQQDAMDRLIKALGDVGAAGRLMGQDMRQIRNALPGINIREAIIKGIFDPTVQADESIQNLRREFGALGATAENAPQAATSAFVDLQRRGLISTTAVVQGLRSSLNNLAGDDALEQFTLTIDGVIEKINEAAQVGSERGFRELGSGLVDQVIPALEQIEEASEVFASSLTNLAIESIPLLLHSFSELTETAGHVFDAMADFAIQNDTIIERSITGLLDVFENLVDIVFVLGEAFAPLAPALFDFINAGLEALLPLLEAITPLIRTLAEAIDAIPAPMLAAALVTRRLGRSMLLLQSAGLAGIGTGLKGIAASLARFGPLGLAIGGTLVAIGQFSSFAREGREAAAELSSEFLDGVDAGREYTRSLESTAGAMKEIGEVDASDAILDLREGLEGSGVEERMDTLRSNIDSMRESMNDPLRLWGATDVVNATIGLEGLSHVDDIERAQSELAGLEAEMAAAELTSQRFDDNLDQLRDTLPSLASGLDDSAAAALLTDDALADLLVHLGYTREEIIELVNQPFGAFIGDVVDKIKGDGGLIGALRGAGVAVDGVDLGNLREEGASVAEVFSEAAAQLDDFTESLLAATDPTFRAIQARRDAAEAEQEIADIRSATVGPEGDFETTEDRLLALAEAELEFAESSAASAAAHSALVQTLVDEETSLTEVTDNIGRVMDAVAEDSSIAEGALATLRDELDLSVEQIEAFARLNPDFNEEDWQLLVDGAKQGADELARLEASSERLAGQAERHFHSVGQSGRSLAADSARWTGQAEQHLGGVETSIGDLVANAEDHFNVFVVAAGEAEQGVEDAMGGTETAVHNTLSAIDAALNNTGLIPRFYSFGTALNYALKRGIDNTSWVASDAAARSAARVESAFGGRLEYASPSKVFERFGAGAIEGFSLGVEDRMPELSGISDRMADALAPPSSAGRPGGNGQFRPQQANSSQGSVVGSMTVVSPDPDTTAKRVSRTLRDQQFLTSGLYPTAQHR